MAPITWSSSKMKGGELTTGSSVHGSVHEPEDSVTKNIVTKNSVTKNSVTKNGFTDEGATEDKVKGDGGDQSADNTAEPPESDFDRASRMHIASLGPNAIGWLLLEYEISQKIRSEVSNWSSVFLDFHSIIPDDEPLFYYYVYNGDLFVVKDNGQPWPWPVVQVDPALLGIPYDPETNAEDAALNLKIAVPHSQLYTYAVYIKELIHPCLDVRKGWSHEVRMLEFLTQKHPHPLFVQYYGCRVVEVPDEPEPIEAGAATEATEAAEAAKGTEVKTVRKQKQKRMRITGIVLERLGRCMADYDPDSDAFRGLDTALFLERLEHVVSFLHSLGLAHNDLKPGNVMLRDNGLPVLIDFESCAEPGTALHTHGTPDWRRSEDEARVSSFENDLFAMDRFREWINDKETVKLYFWGH